MNSEIIVKENAIHNLHLDIASNDILSAGEKREEFIQLQKDLCAAQSAIKLYEKLFNHSEAMHIITEMNDKFKNTKDSVKILEKQFSSYNSIIEALGVEGMARIEDECHPVA